MDVGVFDDFLGVVSLVSMLGLGRLFGSSAARA